MHTLSQATSFNLHTNHVTETSPSHVIDEEANLEKLSCHKPAIAVSAIECKPRVLPKHLMIE